jgi:biotin synthase-related radical SAM superfamily protein
MKEEVKVQWKIMKKNDLRRPYKYRMKKPLDYIPRSMVNHGRVLNQGLTTVKEVYPPP